MKKLKLLITVISFCLFHQFIYACTCVPPPSFCEGISYTYPNGDPYPELIFRGKVTDEISGIDVEINEVLWSDTNLTINTFWFTDCTIVTDPIEEGKEYIFAIRQSTFTNNFNLLDCVISYLTIENEVVVGDISPGVESLSYLEFKDEIESCINTIPTSVENDFSVENNWSVFPNPTVDVLTLKNSNTQNFAKDIQIELIDVVGRKLQTFKKEDGILAGETWSINLQSFSSGVYFLKLIANNQENVIRIVKQ